MKYTNDKCFQNEYQHDTSSNTLIEKSCLWCFMRFCYDTNRDVKKWFVLHATALSLSTLSINTLLMTLWSHFFNMSFSLQQFSTFNCFHSESQLKRILWQMQHHVMITKSLLTLVFRCLRICHDRKTCVRSFISSSKFFRVIHSTKLCSHLNILRNVLLNLSI